MAEMTFLCCSDHCPCVVLRDDGVLEIVHGTVRVEVPEPWRLYEWLREREDKIRPKGQS